MGFGWADNLMVAFVMMFVGYDGPVPIKPASVRTVRAALDAGWSWVCFEDGSSVVVHGDVETVVSKISTGETLLSALSARPHR
jgi:hypothetical protein